MPVGERRNAQPMLPTGGDNNDEGDDGNSEPQDEKKKQQQNAHSSFFRLSPSKSSCKANAEESNSYAEPKPMSHLTKDDYLGLHQRYARLLGDDPQTLSLSKEQE